MTQPSSRPGGGSIASSSARSQNRRRRAWWVGGLVALLALVVGGGVLLAAHNGLFARGPAVDATRAYLSALQRRDYTAAYRMLTPDLLSHESEATFAASMDEIVAADGALSRYQVHDLHDGATSAVVTVELTRAVRGTFTARVQLTRSTGGVWQISAMDDI